MTMVLVIACASPAAAQRYTAKQDGDVVELEMRPRTCHVQRGDHEAAIRAEREALGEPAVTSVMKELPTFFPHRMAAKT
jgi:hypothetical protein